MARAMWKASLELGEVRVPVKLYAAAEDHRPHFRLLHEKDRVPVQQRMVDPRDGREVASDEIRRGIEVEEGVFVLLRPEELQAAQPETSRSIQLLRFVPREALDPSWYSRPYFLGPDGSDADCFALAAALEGSGRTGIARWILRGRRYVGALTPREGHLSLVAFHSTSEVISPAELERPAGSAISAGERKLAEQLLAALDGPFEPGLLRDDYRERVEQLIEAKRAGRRFEAAEAPAARARGDLADALKRSLRVAKERRRAAA